MGSAVPAQEVAPVEDDTMGFGLRALAGPPHLDFRATVPMVAYFNQRAILH